jgi:uncharacterized protein (DUF1015 family)
MPEFAPFRGIRYTDEAGPLDRLIAPPYDVVGDAEQADLEGRSPANAIRVELPRPSGGLDRYQTAAQVMSEWVAEGLVATDDRPAFYVYRMGFRDETGRPRQTGGVLGALKLSPPDGGEILPHERTTAKALGDRLELLRATRANLSPIWALSLAQGLSGLCEPPGPPDGRATDDDGVHHRIWKLDQPGLIEAVSTAVASTPVLIADGHHRYQTALAYQAERREAAQAAPGDDYLLTYVVELNEEQLDVRAIHRLVRGSDPAEVKDVLARHFELFEAGAVDETVANRMVDAGALTLLTPDGTWFLRPTEATETAAEHDLDSSRLDVALADLPGAEVSFQHGWDHVAAAVAEGGTTGVLLRPATVDQIASVAHGGERMPPKTTFFYPKPRTGLVYRGLDA